MNTLRSLLLLACIIAIPVISFAQSAPASTDVTDLPIDGGISLLVAAGIGYGAKKLYNKKKK